MGVWFNDVFFGCENNYQMLTIGCTRSKLIPRLNHGLAQHLMVIHPCRGFFVQFLIEKFFYPHIYKANWGRNSVKDKTKQNTIHIQYRDQHYPYVYFLNESYWNELFKNTSS